MTFIACDLRRFRFDYAVRQCGTDLFYAGGDCAYRRIRDRFIRVEMPSAWIEEARAAWMEVMREVAPQKRERVW